jgi:hypothetical protein
MLRLISLEVDYFYFSFSDQNQKKEGKKKTFLPNDKLKPNKLSISKLQRESQEQSFH